MRKDEIALDLVDIVSDSRMVLERIASSSMEDSVHHEVVQKYGSISSLFKCPRFSCQFFTEGFPSAGEREKHIEKHDRPFRCADEKCTGFALGFTSAVEREKHMKETHSTAAVQDEEFPTDQDVELSIENKTMEGQVTPDPVESSESERETEPQNFPSWKRPRRTEFKCIHCNIVFKKSYNLRSHLRTHNTGRPYECPGCGKGFARTSDLTRHMSSHTGEKRHFCRGFLKNGDPWGCGKAFSRADILRNHYRSKTGQECRRPLLEEQEQEHEEEQTQGMQG